MKYRKRPVIVDAFQLGTDPLPDWFIDVAANGIATVHFNDQINFVTADIETLEGKIHAADGDFIIRGVNGEIYPCKPDIFEKTYEQIGGDLNGKR